MYRRIITNIAWLGGAGALVKPVWLLFMVAVCPRLLGAQEYGTFVAAIAFASIALSFTDLGMSEFTLRSVARDLKLGTSLFANFSILRAGLVLVSSLAAIGVAISIGYHGAGLQAIMLACIFVGATNFALYCRTLFRAHEVLRDEAIFTVVEKLVIMACAIPFLIMTHNAVGGLAGLALGMSVVAIANFGWASVRYAPVRFANLDLNVIKRSIPIMLPLGIAGIFLVVYRRSGLLMVDTMLGPTSAGQFGHASRILDALTMLPVIVSESALFPRFSALYDEGGFLDFNRLFLRGIAALTLVSCLISLLITVAAPSIVHLLVGDPEFQAAVPTLRILCWTFPFLCASSLLYIAIISMDRSRIPVVVLAIGAFFNVSANVFVIPSFGIRGAAVVYVATEVLIVCLYLYCYRTTLSELVKNRLTELEAGAEPSAKGVRPEAA